MKYSIITYLLFVSLAAVIGNTISAQAIVSTTNGPTDSDPSAMLEISSNNSGLLMPIVALTFSEGEIVAPTIPVTPADGLLIYNDQESTNIPRGFWYYDAVDGKWIFYSDLNSTQANQSLDDFAEMYEVQEYGNGTYYELSKDYYVPWASGVIGLKGSSFEFIDSENVTVATGILKPADRYLINYPGEAIYSIMVSVTIASTTPSNTVTGQLFVNGVKADNIFFRNTFQLKNKPTSLNTSGNIQIGPGDKIDFRFISNDKNNGIMVEYVNIRLVKLGDI